jgi:aminomethyltransferase
VNARGSERLGAREDGGGPPEPRLLQSPLHDAHVRAGAKMVEFGGWEMPLAYPRGTLAEHRACRTGAVAFDVSHLGTLRVSGPEALPLLQRRLSNDLRRIAPGRAQYTHLLTEEGGVADDIIVWWVADDRFDVMPNASNTDRVVEALGGVDTTAARAVVAVQGPGAREALGAVSPEAAAVPRFTVAVVEWKGWPLVVAGTGYTGEDGVECAVPAEGATALWDALIGAGIEEAGLGARDTLRLEAGLPLHGHELSTEITPLQAGLSWVIGWDKGDFVGRHALEDERARGPRRRLRGLVVDGRRPPREGAAVRIGDGQVGGVTSGNFSPMLERGIGMALIDTDAGVGEGDTVTLEVRGHEMEAVLAKMPFWPPGGRG